MDPTSVYGASFTGRGGLGGVEGGFVPHRHPRTKELGGSTLGFPPTWLLELLTQEK